MFRPVSNYRNSYTVSLLHKNQHYLWLLTPQPIQEPLSYDEISWLKHIYRQRYSNLFFAGTFRCMAYCFIFSYAISAISIGVLAAAHITDGTTASSFTGNLPIATIMTLSLTALVTAFIYYKMVLPYKKDADCGYKLKIPLIVIAKEYYPLTGQYFIRTDENFEKLKEVDQATFDAHNEGDHMWFYKGKYSGHIFGDNDRVKVRFFAMPIFGRADD